MRDGHRLRRRTGFAHHTRGITRVASLPLPSTLSDLWSLVSTPWWSPRGSLLKGCMASSIYFSRGNGFVEKSHLGNGLPTYSSSSAVREKRHRQQHSSSWLTPVSLPIPGVRTRRLRLMTPNIARLHQYAVTKFGRRRGPFLLVVGFLAVLYLIFAVHKRFGTDDKSWPTPLSLGEPSTLVYRREDLQRIWEWEVSAGHYPSARRSMCCVVLLFQ